VNLFSSEANALLSGCGELAAYLPRSEAKKVTVYRNPSGATCYEFYS
jgi:hypothetical protein